MSLIPPPSDIIRSWLEKGLRTAMEAEYELLRKDLLERLDRQKDTIISGLVLHALKQTDIQAFDDRVTITVKTNPIHLKS